MSLTMGKKYLVNMKGVIIILLAIIHSSLFAQTGWYPLESGTSNILKSIYFPTLQTGYMSGEGIILKSTNGGNNWLVINNMFGGRSLQFLDANTGYVCDGTIYKTFNGGISWQDLNLTQLNALYFINETTGIAVGKNNQILKTVNGGQTWELQPTGAFYNKYNCVVFLNENVGFTVGGKSVAPFSGIIYKTTNGGVVWNLTQESEDIDFRSIDFVNDNTGYAVGGSESASTGVIYKTTNSGETWVQQGIVNRDLNAVNFSSVNTGYTVGEDGMILKTTNGSIVWNTQVSNTTEDINSVFFVRDDVGYTAGNSGVAQKTVNGGVFGPPFGISGRVLFTTGQYVTSGKVKALRYVSGVIQVVDTATIQSDGTYTLSNVPQDSVDIMAFPDDEDTPLSPLFVPTYYGGNGIPTINWAASNTLYPTNNLFNINISAYPVTGTGGARFIGGGVYTTPPNINVLPGSIVYAKIGNDFKGYGIARSNGIYDVNNLASGSYSMICDRFGYRGATRSVLLGANDIDTINFYLLGIEVIGIQPVGGIIPSAYKLDQNYPNPFNPVTNIKIDIPKSASVKVSVYDMLGRELDVLVNENLQAGSYKLSWNAVKYSSGIYFYKIISGDFTETKKMMLVK